MVSGEQDVIARGSDAPTFGRPRLAPRAAGPPAGIHVRRTLRHGPTGLSPIDTGPDTGADVGSGLNAAGDPGALTGVDEDAAGDPWAQTGLDNGLGWFHNLPEWNDTAEGSAEFAGGSNGPPDVPRHGRPPNLPPPADGTTGEDRPARHHTRERPTLTPGTRGWPGDAGGSSTPIGALRAGKIDNDSGTGDFGSDDIGSDDFGSDDFGTDDVDDDFGTDDRADGDRDGEMGAIGTAASGRGAAAGVEVRRAVRAPRLSRSWGRFAELWIPEPLRDARIDPGRRGALILLLVAALAAVATAAGVWRDRPEPMPVGATSLTAMAGASALSGAVGSASTANTRSSPGGVAGPTAVAEAPSAAPADSGPIVVSVTGLIARPGLVKLPVGSRVADAIAAAGGADANADVTGMNLAARLSDGDSIVVGETPAVVTGPAAGPAAGAAAGPAAGTAAGSVSASVAAGAAPPGGLIDLNTADEAALDTLPGVGPVMAANILAWRQANGRFTSVEQLQEISGVGPSRFAQIAPLVTVS